MEKFELSHDSKSTIRDPFPTMAQDPGSGMQVKMRTEHSSRLEEIEREIVNDEQDMDPPGLTDSEDEEESEEETEDEQHSSCHPTPTLTMTFTEASYTSSDSSDEETQELRIYKEMKSKLHRSKAKHLF